MLGRPAERARCAGGERGPMPFQRLKPLGKGKRGLPRFHEICRFGETSGVKGAIRCGLRAGFSKLARVVLLHFQRGGKFAEVAVVSASFSSLPRRCCAASRVASTLSGLSPTRTS